MLLCFFQHKTIQSMIQCLKNGNNGNKKTVWSLIKILIYIVRWFLSKIMTLLTDITYITEKLSRWELISLVILKPHNLTTWYQAKKIEKLNKNKLVINLLLMMFLQMTLIGKSKEKFQQLKTKVNAMQDMLFVQTVLDKVMP